MLNDDRLKKHISNTYGFTDFKTVDAIRKKSNYAKHDKSSVPISASEKKEFFQCVYSFCSCFYKRHAKKQPPKWNNQEYEALLNTYEASQVYKKREKEYSQQITSLHAELKSAKAERDSIEQNIRSKVEHEYSSKIISLKNELARAESSRLAAQKDVRKELEQDYLNKVNSLKAQLEHAEASMLETLENARNNLKEQYSQKIRSLQTELESAESSRAAAEEKLISLQKKLDGETLQNLPTFSTEYVEDPYSLNDINNISPKLQLSDSQKQAIECTDKYIAVVAGPGSGKTRVLTERIRHLVNDNNVPENRILALTFSSKAANEIRKRLMAQMGIRACRIEIKTFHSFGLQTIRQNADLLGLTPELQILDETGKNRIIRNLITSSFPRMRYRLPDITSIAHDISAYKSGLSTSGSSYIQPLTEAYNKELVRMNCIDFDDMVCLSKQLLNRKELRPVYKQRYQHVLVDEVQDVNKDQKDILRALTGPSTTLFMVGDDDQCIYEWRGAIPSFIQDIAKSPAFTVIRLEDNYRSASSIVRASASFISRNINRIAKHIRAHKTNPEHVSASAQAYWLPDVNKEAAFIANTIQQLVANENYTYDDITILVRAHNQYPAICSALFGKNIPFYCQEDRSHYDSFIPVLRAVADIQKRGNINRAVDFPTRVMDNFLYTELKEKYHLSKDLPALDTFDFLCDQPDTFEHSSEFRGRFQLIRELNSKVQMLTVSEIVKSLIDYYSNEGNHEESKQMADAISLLNLAVEFDKSYSSSPNPAVSPLDDFLDYILLSQEDNSEENNPDHAVNLMTCHRSKGLEFPVVFIPGIQCGTFPDDKHIFSAQDLEAERRLLYVSMTRAIDRLYLTCNSNPYTSHQLIDNNNHPIVSIKGFLADIPDLVIKQEQ